MAFLTANAQQSDSLDKSNDYLWHKRTAWPRVYLGAKGGFGFATFRGTEVQDANLKLGAAAGVWVRLQLHRRWSLQLETMYGYRAANAQVVDAYPDMYDVPVTGPEEVMVEVRSDANLYFHYLDIPLLVQFDVISKPGFQAFVASGPVLSAKLANSADGTTDVYVSEVSFFDQTVGPGTALRVQTGPLDQSVPSFPEFGPLDFGVAFGGGSRVRWQGVNLLFDMRYTLGLININKRDTNPMYGGALLTMVGVEF